MLNKNDRDPIFIVGLALMVIIIVGACLNLPTPV